MLAKLAAACLILSLPSAAHAQSPCDEPVRPSCITGFTTFEDQFSYDLCRREVQDYEDDVNAFLGCLLDWFDETGRQAEREKDAALSEYEDAVRYWNCKSQDPGGFCVSP